MAAASLRPRPRVLLVAPPSSYRTVPFLRAGERLGVDVLVASAGAAVPVPTRGGGIHVDARDPERALAVILAHPGIDLMGAVVGTEDVTTELAAHVARALGLPHNAPAAVRAARRKDVGRRLTARAGLRTPRAVTVDLDRPLERQIRAVRFPSVVKPLALSASRGVIRVDSTAALRQAVARVAPLLAEIDDAAARRRLLVEDFVPGVEVAVEGLLRAGTLRVLAVFDKPDPLDGPFFEETYYVSPSRFGADVQRAVAQEIERVCLAYGLREGPVHAECRINERGVWVLEAAARTIGGDCARLFHLASGQSLEERVLAHALGLDLPAAGLDGGFGVLMIPVPRAGVLRRVEGVASAMRVPYVEKLQIDVRDGQVLVPWPEGSSYTGFVYARAPSAALAEAALREAHRQLNFVIAPLLPLELGAAAAQRAQRETGPQGAGLGSP